MASQVTLLLTCMLFSKALSLTCCESSTPEICRYIDSCKDKCVTTTTVIKDETNQHTQYYRSCSRPDNEICKGYSLTAAGMNVKVNAECCSTDRCNIKTLPVPLKVPNGRVCYSCLKHTCTLQVQCEADEFYCFTVTGKESMKGCASKSYCDMSNIIFDPAKDESHMQCCQGNLCNGAESFILSFLLLFIPVLFSILMQQLSPLFW